MSAAEQLLTDIVSYRIILIAGSVLIGFIAGTVYWRFIRWKRISRRFKKHSHAVLTGQINEQLAPYLPGFPYKPSESKFLGKPIDFIVFQGLNREAIEHVVFVEVKTGKNKRLSKSERSLKQAILEGRIKWHQYDFDPTDE